MATTRIEVRPGWGGLKTERHTAAATPTMQTSFHAFLFLNGVVSIIVFVDLIIKSVHANDHLELRLFAELVVWSTTFAC